MVSEFHLRKLGGQDKPAEVLGQGGEVLRVYTLWVGLLSIIFEDQSSEELGEIKPLRVKHFTFHLIQLIPDSLPVCLYIPNYVFHEVSESTIGDPGLLRIM